MKLSKTETRKNTSVKKSNKVSETPTQSKLSMIRKSPSVRKYAANKKSEMSMQEKQTSYTEINVVKNIVTTKEPGGLKNLGKTCYMNVIFQCLSEGASSVRSPKQLVRKDRRAGDGITKVSTQYKRKSDISSASKTYCQC